MCMCLDTRFKSMYIHDYLNKQKCIQSFLSEKGSTLDITCEVPFNTILKIVRFLETECKLYNMQMNDY